MKIADLLDKLNKHVKVTIVNANNQLIYKGTVQSVPLGCFSGINNNVVYIPEIGIDELKIVLGF